MSLLVYPKVIPYAKFEHFEHVRASACEHGVCASVSFEFLVVFERHVRQLTLRLAQHVCRRFVLSAERRMLCYCLRFWTSMKRATTHLPAELWAGGSHVIGGHQPTDGSSEGYF